MSTRVVYNNLPGLSQQTEQILSRAVAKAAFDIEANARANTTRVDTGAMKGGWTARIISPLRAEVASGPDYTMWHEFGTRHMSATPMIRPAYARVFPAFASAVGQALRGMR